MLDLYDRPLWRDWLFYVTVVGLIAALVEPGTWDDPIIFVLSVGIQLFLFGVVPGRIRAYVRRRREPME